MLVCVFVYLANVCENDVVVRCCFASQLCVCVCVCVHASHCVVVGSITMYSSVLALCVWCTDGDGHATMCVFADVLMAGCTWMVLLYARRLERLAH